MFVNPFPLAVIPIILLLLKCGTEYDTISSIFATKWQKKILYNISNLQSLNHPLKECYFFVLLTIILLSIWAKRRFEQTVVSCCLHFDKMVRHFLHFMSLTPNICRYISTLFNSRRRCQMIWYKCANELATGFHR